MTRLKIRFRYHNRALPRLILVLALLPFIALTALVMNGRRANASPQLSPDVINGYRQYYLTRMLYKANEARDACAAGYHFASIWEIADPSTLKYNRSLGLFSPDSGEGPPVTIKFFQGSIKVSGWVRTGRLSSITGIEGQANCYLWNSGLGTDWGTTAELPDNWTSAAQDVCVWDVGVRTCNSNVWVWCVADDSVFRIHLPLIRMD